MLNYSHSTKKISNTKVNIEVTVGTASFNEEKELQYKKLSKDIEIKGFRAGKAPRPAIEERLGVVLYNETINALLPKISIEILEKENIVPVASLDYEIKEFDIDKDLKFVATVHVYPEFSLPNFKKLSVKKDSSEVTEEEFNEFFENFVKDIEKRSGKDTKDFNSSKINDQWVVERKIKDVTTVEGLKKYIKDYLEHEKKHKVDDKYINDILLAACEEAKIEVPEILIENEVNARNEEDKERLEKLGINWEDWMKQQKENFDKQMIELRKNLEKSLKTQFLLSKIIKEKNIEVTDEELDSIINSSNEKKVIQTVGEDNVKNTLKDQLLNQKLVDWVLKEVESK